MAPRSFDFGELVSGDVPDDGSQFQVRAHPKAPFCSPLPYPLAALWSVSSVRVAPPGTNNRWRLRPRNLDSGGRPTMPRRTRSPFRSESNLGGAPEPELPNTSEHRWDTGVRREATGSTSDGRRRS